MSESTDKVENQAVELPRYKFSDDVIAIVRELVQLSLLTGTNIIDHLRAVVLTPEEGNAKLLTLDEEYVKSYNAYITHLNETALQQAQEMQSREAEVEA